MIANEIQFPIMIKNAVEIAKALIQCPSITPNDAGCQPLIADMLQKSGFSCQFLLKGAVSNLWAALGAGKPMLVFAGHTDVVPPGESWRHDPFLPVLENGKLYGRGACDMKGALAAMVAAAMEFAAKGPSRGTLAFLLTSDEEGPAVDGTAHVLSWLAEKDIVPDYAIVGEPTAVNRPGDTIKNGRRGSFSVDLEVNGIQGHIAYPQRAKNPIHLLAPALTEMVTAVWDEGDDFFPPTSFQISKIYADGGAENIIPGKLYLRGNFRFCPKSAPETLKEKFEDILKYHGIEYSARWRLSAKPYFTAPGRLTATVSDVAARIFGMAPELSTSGGTSDGRFLAAICPEVIEFGPIGRSAHQVDEWVEVEDLQLLAKAYLQIMECLLR